MRDKILLLKGGNSSEREISLHTGSSVEQALVALQMPFDVVDVPSLKEVMSLPFEDYQGVFLALHGGFGENGTIQAILESINVPFNGASGQASTICMSKHLTKLVVRDWAVATPDCVFVPSRANAQGYADLVGRLGHRFIVKPDAEGCSVGVSLVSSAAEFDQAFADAAAFERGVLCEEFIEGDEITVGYLNGRAMPPLAITFSQEFFSWEAKFQSSNSTAFAAASLPDTTQKRIERSMSAIAQALNIEDYFRADFIVRDSQAYLLEINTLPGLNHHSVFPKGCELANISYNAMIEGLIKTWPKHPASDQAVA
ncbi:D-alanine--D-alanine ligase family protein [Neorhizobium sp. DAR64860/K0K1]|uniref:D-alanine--D-alanine ligase family protein n=1 Tax=Neorhizobium sp. DAR64860/K0K1 TaxID=3421955 RepID=UPI003D2D2E44